MSSAPHLPAAEWTRRPERGSLALIRFMAWASLRGGRRLSRALLYPIVGYFFCTAARARGAAREYLRRCLAREPSARELFRLFLNFATTIHDRVYFLQGRFDVFEIEIRGADQFDDDGALLLGAHVGSFEALHACGRRLQHRRVTMAMYEENARKLNAVLAAIDPAVTEDIIGLGHVNSMLELRSRVEAGGLVGILGDRALDHEPQIHLPFLGAPAPFPIGPMRIAAVLRRRVFFMAGIYRGRNRYEVRFEPLADFSDLDTLEAPERARRVEEGVREYVRRLEQVCREAPDNWFNFHRFWPPAA